MQLINRGKNLIQNLKIVCNNWSKEKKILFGTFTFFLLFSVTFLFLYFKHSASIRRGTKPLPSTFHEILPGELIEPSPSVPSITSGEILVSPTPTAKVKLTITASPTLKASPTPIPTPTTRTPNPPIINISYPSEMQSIEFTSSDQRLCIVDSPTGGDTSGLQRKHNTNDSGWSGYADIFTLCFDPKEGLNRIQLQYKNRYGEESAMYTRQFSFHRIADITISLSGQLYRDVNCNAARDGGETAVTTTTQVNIFQMPEYYLYGTVNSDTNGNFSFSATIKENVTLTLKPGPVSPDGYKSNPHYTVPSTTFSSSNRSATIEIPQVPNENVGTCY